MDFAPTESKSERRKSLNSQGRDEQVNREQQEGGQVDETNQAESKRNEQSSRATRMRQRTLTRQAASLRDLSPTGSSSSSHQKMASLDLQQCQNESDRSQDLPATEVSSINSKGSSKGSEEEREEPRRRRRSRRKSRSTVEPETTEQAQTHELDEPSQESEQPQQDPQTDLRRRQSQSQPPSERRQSIKRTPSRQTEKADSDERPQDQLQPSQGHRIERRACSVSPSLAASVNIRQILENVAELEGPFQDSNLALRVALSALDGPCWSTKVEGLLALIRLASHHQQVLGSHLHEVVIKIAQETRNLRSTVARSAIFALGDLSAKLKRQVEPELDIMVPALLHKSMENTAFIRDDIRRALQAMVDSLTQWRLANCLIAHGGLHKSVHVRRMASQFVACLVERMGAAKCLVGARDISANLIPAAARFAQDGSPHTRYYGRLILDKIMGHGAFERLARKHLAPNLYRSTIGIIESVKRRGPASFRLNCDPAHLVLQQNKTHSSFS